MFDIFVHRDFYVTWHYKGAETSVARIYSQLCSHCVRPRMTRKAIFTIRVRKTVLITTTLKSMSIQITLDHVLVELNTSISLM